MDAHSRLDCRGPISLTPARRRVARERAAWLATVLIGLLVGCSEPSARLAIDLRTDAVPGVEFFAVVT
jgi:hypothetical protein